MSSLGRLVTAFLLVAQFSAFAAEWRMKPGLRRMVQRAQADREWRQAKECEFAILSVEQMQARLLELTGEADKALSEGDYGSDQAREWADEIRVLANELVKKTSTDNRLALEAFVFARDISGRNPTRRPR